MRSNWAGNYSYRAAGLAVPSDLAEVQDRVRGAARVRVLGSRHSFNDIADTEGIQISLERLTRVGPVDPAARQVTVEGGIRYGDLAPALHREGWALANLASLPHISVAGAVATATHGSGSETGNLATSVAGLEIVTAGGEILRLSRRSDPGMLAGAVVSLGALGAVVGLVLDVEPDYQVRQTVYTGLAHDLLETDFDALFAFGTSVSVFTDWRGARAQSVWVKDRLRDPGAPVAADCFGAVRAERPLHPLPDGSGEDCTGQMGVPGPWHERLPHFRMGFTPSRGEEIQAEYFLPRAEAGRAVAALRRHCERLAPVLLVSEVRTVAGDGLWLSPCRRGPQVAVHFTFRRDPAGVRAVLPALEADLGPLGAVPHWGKVTAMDPAVIVARTPGMRDFRDLVRQLDPGGKFANAYLDRLFAALG